VQNRLGHYSGFFRTYLSRIETGVANPTLNAIEVISIALDVRLVDVFLALEVPQQV
jgi:transcriptional regulator with XRE-family HTH domain